MSHAEYAELVSAKFEGTVSCVVCRATFPVNEKHSHALDTFPAEKEDHEWAREWGANPQDPYFTLPGSDL